MMDLTRDAGTTSAGGRVRADRAIWDERLPPTAEAGAGQAHDIETLQQRWDAASHTAVRRQWTVAPEGSRLCADAADADHGTRAEADAHGAPTASTDDRRAAAFLRHMTRQRRATAGRGDATSTAVPVEAPSDVVVVPVPRHWEIRTKYTLVEVLRGLSSCSAPFTHASQLADDLFAVSTHPNYTASQRAMIRTGAIVADQLTGLAPQVFLLQSVCKLFRILADLIEAKPITPGDILDINMLGRHLMVLKRLRSPLYVNPKFAPPRQRRPTGALGIARVKTPLHRPAAASDAVGPEAHHAAVYYGEQAAGRPGTPPLWADEMAPAQTTLEFFYTEVAEREVAASNERLAGSGHDAETPGRPPSRQAVPPPARESSPAQLDAERAAIRRIAADVAPAPVQWTRVKSVPLRRRTDLAGQWERFPVSAYQVRGIDLSGTAPGERFRQNGRDYLHIEGAAVAVRELLPGELWIVDNRVYPDTPSSAERLPPLPLWKNSGGWAVQEPELIDAPDAHGMPVSDDGYVRVQRRTFVQIDGVRVETSRVGIDDEATLRPLAQPLPDPVPGADAMQIIWAADGQPWIEGEHGYYRLRFDLDQQEFHVVGAQAADGASDHAPRLVDFDVQRHRWSAIADKGARDGPMPYGDTPSSPRGNAPADEATFFDRAGPSVDARVRQEAPLASADDIASVPGAPARERMAPRAESEDLDDTEEAVEAQGAVASDREPFPALAYDAKQTRLEREFALFGHYARNIKKLPFLSSARIGPGASLRRKLRRGLREALFALEDESMVPVNRMDRNVRLDFTPQVLGFRQSLRGLYPSLAKWRGMTLQEKQYEVGIMVDLAYTKAGPDMWPCLAGYCHEIADVMLNALTVPRQKLRENLLQVALADQAGVKGTHVILVYADDAATLSVFGDLSLRDVRFQRSRPTLSDAEFYSWLLQHRDSVLLIDAWSTTKFVDLSNVQTVEAVRDQLRPNLFEAGFEVAPNLSRFQVSAVLPERPELTPRRR